MFSPRTSACAVVFALATFALAACSKEDGSKTGTSPEPSDAEASGEVAATETEESAGGDAASSDDSPIPPRGDDSDRASKNGRAEGAIDGVDVTVTYGRPKVKGRTLWGELVPYGNVWRTGANEATTITFAEDVTVEGEPLAAGTYALFTIPTEDDGWTVIFNEQAKQWGAYDYDESKDALRVVVEPGSLESSVEELTFEFAHGGVAMLWGETAVGFAVSAS